MIDDDDIKNLRPGDWIKFRSPTRYSGAPAIRVVNGFWPGTDKPTVHYNGWDDFVVKPHEIIEIYKNERN